MHRHKLRFRQGAWAWCGAAAIMLTACGGGGGSGGNEATSGLRITNVRSLAAVSAEVFAGNEAVPNYRQEIRFDFEGDLGQMVGQSFHVSLDDPVGLFNPSPPITVSYADGKNHGIGMSGRAVSAAGDFSGNVRVNVCFDAACQRRVGGEPILVPYNVRVRAGLRIKAAPPPVAVQFGVWSQQVGGGFDPADPHIRYRVDELVDLPPGGRVTGMSLYFPGATGVRPPMPFTGGDRLVTLAPDDAAGLDWIPGPAPVGRYQLQLNVEGTAPINGTVNGIRASTLVNMEVLATPGKSVWLLPESINVVGQLPAQVSVSTINQRVLAADGTNYDSLSRVVYLPAGAGNADAGGIQWLSQVPCLVFNCIGYQPYGSGQVPLQVAWCVFRSDGTPPSPCLSAGRYQALAYLKSAAGVELATPLPVTLTLQPPAAASAARLSAR